MVKPTAPDLPALLSPTDAFRKLLQADEQLSNIHVSHADISELRAISAIINESRLDYVICARAHLEKLQLTDCILDHCDLTAASLPDAGWRRIAVKGSRCTGLQLQNGVLKDVRFTGCKLDLANLRFCRLENVVFENCTLSELDLYHASLKHVSFAGSTIENVEFSDTTLYDVDLSSAELTSLKGLRYLKGVTISSLQLVQLAPALAHEIGLIITD